MATAAPQLPPPPPGGAPATTGTPAMLAAQPPPAAVPPAAPYTYPPYGYPGAPQPVAAAPAAPAQPQQCLKGFPKVADAACRRRAANQKCYSEPRCKGKVLEDKFAGESFKDKCFALGGKSVDKKWMTKAGFEKTECSNLVVPVFEKPQFTSISGTQKAYRADTDIHEAEESAAAFAEDAAEDAGAHGEGPFCDADGSLAGAVFSSEDASFADRSTFGWI
eukprot:tig00000113_g5709.t1